MYEALQSAMVEFLLAGERWMRENSRVSRPDFDIRRRRLRPRRRRLRRGRHGGRRFRRDRGPRRCSSSSAPSMSAALRRSRPRRPGCRTRFMPRVSLRTTASRTLRDFSPKSVGNRSSASLREAFLRAGPDAIATLEAKTDVKFRPYATHPDYEQEAEGATMRGRALEPVPFDGGELGPDRHRIRPPIPEFTLFGGMMVDRTDIGHLLNLKNSRASFLHAAKILARYALDRLSGPRGSRLVMGNALIGRMMLSLKKRGGEIVLETSVAEFITGARGVEGVVLRGKGGERRVRARLGVVLAAGGFNRGRRRAEMLHDPVPQHSPAAPGPYRGDAGPCASARRAHGEGESRQRLLGAGLDPATAGRDHGSFPAFRARQKQARHRLRRPDGPSFRQRVDLLPPLCQSHVRGEPHAPDHPLLHHHGRGRPEEVRAWHGADEDPQPQTLSR